MKIPQLRLGPTDTTPGIRTAIQELLNRLNQLIQAFDDAQDQSTVVINDLDGGTP